MVRKEQASQQPNDESTPLHPLLRNLSKLDDQIQRLKDKKAAQDFDIEEREAWKLCVTGMASTPNGQMFLKAMLQHSGIFAMEEPNAQVMIEGRYKSAFYRKWVRPFIPKELRLVIE